MQNPRFSLAQSGTALVAVGATLLTMFAALPAHAADAEITSFSADVESDGSIKLSYSYNTSWSTPPPNTIVADFRIQWFYSAPFVFQVFSQTSGQGIVSGSTTTTYGSGSAPKSYRADLAVRNDSNQVFTETHSYATGI